MRAKKYLILLGAIAVFVGVLWASEPPKKAPSIPKIVFAKTQRDALKGLEGVHVSVLVQKHDPEGQKYVSEEQLQNDVKLLLRKYGIRIISADEGALAWTFAPTVQVRVYQMVVPQLLCVLESTVSLREIVWLPRNLMHTHADTWERSIVGRSALDGDVGGVIRKWVKDSVEILINDYLAANPKETVIIPTNSLYKKPTEPNKPKDEQKQ